MFRVRCRGKCPMCGRPSRRRIDTMHGADTESRHEGRLLDPDAAATHLDRLYRAAWALCGSREQAEDLVQDTYARLLARPRFLRSDDDLGYLLRVLRNFFASKRRSAGGSPAIDDPPDLLDRIFDPSAHEP